MAMILLLVEERDAIGRDSCRAVLKFDCGVAARRKTYRPTPETTGRSARRRVAARAIRTLNASAKLLFAASTSAQELLVASTVLRSGICVRAPLAEPGRSATVG